MTPKPFAVDTVLNQRYILTQLLGEAPSRQTWLATDQGSGDRVVVKLLIFGQLMEWQDLKLFEREAEILQHLDHPHIPRYRDHFSNPEPPSWFASIYTYIPGQSLQDLLDQDRQFTNRELRQIATEVLDILSYLHGQSPVILHRDIKPSNLISGEDRQIYLVDFGAVQAQDMSLGKTFTVVGTYGYTPMEQYGGRAVPASDLYALGVTMIHLATGLSPVDLPQKEMRLLFQDKVDLRDSAALESSLIHWIERLSEPMLEHRIQSAQEAIEVLRSPQALSQRSPRSIDRARPRRTLISIEHSKEFLRISIPNIVIRDIRNGAVLMPLKLVVYILICLILLIIAISIVGIVFTQLNWFTIVFGLVFLFSIYRILFILLRTTDIVLTKNSIDVRRLLGERIVSRRQFPVSKVDNLFREKSRSNIFQGDNMIVYFLGIRDLDGQEIHLNSNGITWKECVWLEQEIESWLRSR